jgi:Zn-dependent peptidase ImmA (M78 family)
MSSTDLEIAKQEAEKLIEEMNITSPVVNVFEVAKRAGLDVEYFVPEGRMEQVAGFFDPASKTIYVNQGDSPQRQAFTIAHELGHFRLNHEPTEYEVLMRFQDVTMRRNATERQADEFAGNLLVPIKMLRKARKDYSLDDKDTDIEILARLFGVSKDVIKIRLQRLRENSFF